MLPGVGETDIDTCVPSTLLVAMMVRWMLVFEERDADTIWLLKTAPRRLYPAGADVGDSNMRDSFVAVRRAATRFGWISFTIGAVAGPDAEPEPEHGKTNAVLSTVSALRLVANVTLVLHGRGFVAAGGGLAVALRLRDPSGQRLLRSATIAGTPPSAVTVVDVDTMGETVVVEVARASVQAPRDDTRTVSFILAAMLQ